MDVHDMNGEVMKQHNNIEINMGNQQSERNSNPSMPDSIPQLGEVNVGQVLDVGLKKADNIEPEERKKVLEKLTDFQSYFAQRYDDSEKFDTGVGISNVGLRVAFRKELVERMFRAVSVYKTTVSENKIQKSHWLAALNVIKEAELAKQNIENEDKELEPWVKVDEKRLKHLAKDILDDANMWTDSNYYESVTIRLNAYMNRDSDDDGEALRAVIRAVNTYINVRSKNGTKKSFSTSKGQRRMDRMQELKKLLDKLNYAQKHEPAVSNEAIDEQLENTKDIEYVENSYDDEVLEVRESEETIQLREQAAYENDIKRIEKCCNSFITEDMIKPSYVREHSDYFRTIINNINDAKRIIDKYTSQKLDADKLDVIRNMAEEMILKYGDGKLESYVNACLNKKSRKSDLEKMQKGFEFSYTNEQEQQLITELQTDYFTRSRNFSAIVKMNEKKGIKAKGNDWNRFATIVEPYKLDSKTGNPVNLDEKLKMQTSQRQLSAILSGSDEECVQAFKELFEKASKFEVKPKMLEEADIMKNFVKYYGDYQLVTNLQNLLKIRPEAARLFENKYPDLVKLVNPQGARARAVTDYGAVLSSFAAIHGFGLSGDVKITNKDGHDTIVDAMMGSYIEAVESTKNSLKGEPAGV